MTITDDYDFSETREQVENLFQDISDRVCGGEILRALRIEDDFTGIHETREWGNKSTHMASKLSVTRSKKNMLIVAKVGGHTIQRANVTVIGKEDFNEAVETAMQLFYKSVRMALIARDKLQRK